MTRTLMKAVTSKQFRSLPFFFFFLECLKTADEIGNLAFRYGSIALSFITHRDWVQCCLLAARLMICHLQISIAGFCWWRYICCVKHVQAASRSLSLYLSPAIAGFRVLSGEFYCECRLSAWMERVTPARIVGTSCPIYFLLPRCLNVYFFLCIDSICVWLCPWGPFAC